MDVDVHTERRNVVSTGSHWHADDPWARQDQFHAAFESQWTMFGQQEGPILFYDKDQPYYAFTNFSYHPIVHEGFTYPTAEHLFQASKFLQHHPRIAEKIRYLPTPRAALQEATRLQRLRRPDWFDVNLGIMDEILEAKFTQHADLVQLLVGTGDRELIEASPVDSFWGAGEDGQGRNELGKALMRLRNKLRGRVREHDVR